MFPLVDAFDDRYEPLKAILSLLLLLWGKLWVKVLDSNRVLMIMGRFHGCLC